MIDKLYVYTITCPLNKAVIYVGVTADYESRIKQHIFNKKNELGLYIQNLLKEGHKPLFTICEQLEIFAARKREKELITEYTEQGIKLFNKLPAAKKKAELLRSKYELLDLTAK